MSNGANYSDLKRDLPWDPFRKDPLFERLLAELAPRIKEGKVTPHPGPSMVDYLRRLPRGRSIGSEVWVMDFEFGTIAGRFSLIVRYFESNRDP